MLIAFNVRNYRSFKDVASFSMVAANLKSKNKRIVKAGEKVYQRGGVIVYQLKSKKEVLIDHSL